MYDLILKPVSALLIVLCGLFLFHVFGPEIAESICPVFGENEPERSARCTGFFNVLH
ncbi:MAG: hypothetical protein AB3N23_12675 [Paracoccaceae bacterium]